MYKQLIIARSDLNMRPAELATQVSSASMAFLIAMIRRAVIERHPYRYLATDPETGKVGPYRRADFWNWAKEAHERGEKYFYAKPVGSHWEYQLCEDEIVYETKAIKIDKELFNGSFATVVCGARDMEELQKAIDKAIGLGMREGEDFFVIRDEPEEILLDGSEAAITCIGFKPMPAEIIDQIGKEYNLF